jgi:hypothetical protein
MRHADGQRLEADAGVASPPFRAERRDVAFERSDPAGDSVRISLAGMVKELESLGMGVAAIALSLGIEENLVEEYLGRG